MKTFVQYLREKGYAENTVDSYSFAICQLIDKTQSLTNQSLLAHKEWLVSSFAPKTANNRIGAINTYLDFIAFDGIRLKGVRIQQKPFLDNVITNEQYIQLISGLKQDGDWFWYFIVRFLGCTGARVSELRQFKVEHVTAGYMDIVSKGQKLRRIWIPDSLREESLTWKAKPNEWPSISRQKRQRDYFARHIHRVETCRTALWRRPRRRIPAFISALVRKKLYQPQPRYFTAC